MTKQEIIIEHIETYLEDKKTLFLVSVKVTPDNNIRVFLDGYDGVTVENCIALSRYIESQMDREKEDFSLEVSSAGLGTPFQVPEQYQKAKGKQVEVKFKDGMKVFGVLTEITEKNIVLEVHAGVKKDNSVSLEAYLFDDILTTKEVITF